MGGQGPHCGNIIVGGRPVCDDGHNAANALVVCRFAQNVVSFSHKDVMNIFFAGCWAWGPNMRRPLTSLSLDQSQAPSQWTTFSARATKHLSSTAPISLWMIVALMRERESSAQTLKMQVGFRKTTFQCLYYFCATCRVQPGIQVDNNDSSASTASSTASTASTASSCNCGMEGTSQRIVGGEDSRVFLVQHFICTVILQKSVSTPYPPTQSNRCCVGTIFAKN